MAKREILTVHCGTLSQTFARASAQETYRGEDEALYEFLDGLSSRLETMKPDELSPTGFLFFFAAELRRYGADWAEKYSEERRLLTSAQIVMLLTATLPTILSGMRVDANVTVGFTDAVLSAFNESLFVKIALSA